jgi:glutathione S-transferase
MMVAPSIPLTLLGAPGSPYTRKMLALLRYRRVPYRILWGSHQAPPAGLPAPKVRLLPTVYFPGSDGSLEAAVDSTPIIRRLEALVSDRSVLPGDPVLSFLNDLFEDYADEWLTKAMFHYRWHHAADRAHAGPMLVFWAMPRAEPEQAAAAAVAITRRQHGRLHVVGSSDATAPTIEASYARFLALLDPLIAARGFVLGERPASADFAIYGQLSQLGIVDPTPAAVMECHPRVRAWLDRVEDLSGEEVRGDGRDGDGGWMTRAEAAAACRPFLLEIGRVYAPFLLANAAAVAAGDRQVETEIDGRTWVQPPFPYQAKCLDWLRAGRAALLPADREALDSILSGTGCERLFEGARGRTG